MSAQGRLVCLGDLMVEYILRVPSPPGADSTLILDGERAELGGPAFNICGYLARFGRRPRLVGAYGRRHEPVVAEGMAAAGLDREGLVAREGDADVLVAYITDSHHYSLYLRATVPEEVAGTLYDRARDARWLILMGSRHAAIRRTFRRLADGFRGDLLAFNPSYALPEYDAMELGELFGRSQIALVNEQEAKAACRALGAEDEWGLAKRVGGSLIVTRGARGLRVYRGGRILEAESVAAAKANAVGAGDAFFAGFLHETLAGADALEAARFGVVLAAFEVESGQVRAFVREGQVRERLARQWGKVAG